MPNPQESVQSVLNGAADGQYNLRVSAVPGFTNAVSYKNITGASAVTVKSGAGQLKNIVFHTSGTARIVITDNTTFGGTVIGTIDGVPTKLTTLTYNADFTTGLTISAVSAPGDFTVTWA